jgi:N-acetylmuramoyl-L-alanine amidase
MVKKYTLGAIPSRPDKRNYKYAKYFGTYEAFDEEYTSPFVPEVKDQNGIGACVGCSFSYIGEIQEYIENNHKIKLAPSWIYGNRYEGQYMGEGMEPKDAAANVVKDGILSWEYMPWYQTFQNCYNFIHKEENEKLFYAKAYPRKAKAYYEIDVKNINEILTAIKDTGAINIDIAVYPSFYDCPKNGILPQVKNSEYITGYHALTAYGWTTIKGKIYLKIINSWGTDWGNKGHCLMPIDYKGLYEAWAIADQVNLPEPSLVPKVGVDIGHGGKDPGAVGPTGVKEKDVNLGIGLALINALKRNDVEVVATRTEDKYLTLFERSNLFNKEMVDLAVSVHCNGSDNPSADYIATFVFKKGYKAENAAILVQRELVKLTNWEDGSIREKNLHMVRETKMPAILPECGFLTNPQQEKWLSQPENQTKLGEAIAKGVCAFLGIPFKERESKFKIIKIDVPPFIKNKRTFLPVRALIEAAGGSVVWNSSSRTVTCHINNRKITMQIDNPEIKVEIKIKEV